MSCWTKTFCFILKPLTISFIRNGQPLFYACKTKPLQLNISSFVLLKFPNDVEYGLLPFLDVVFWEQIKLGKLISTLPKMFEIVLCMCLMPN